MFHVDIDSFKAEDKTVFSFKAEDFTVQFKLTDNMVPYIFTRYNGADEGFIDVPLIWNAFGLKTALEANTDNAPAIDGDAPIENIEYLPDGEQRRHLDTFDPAPGYVKSRYEALGAKIYDTGHSAKAPTLCYPLLSAEDVRAYFTAI